MPLVMGKLTAEQRLQKAVVDITANSKYMPLAGVLMIGKRTVTDDPRVCPTAATNGRDEIYNRQFVEKQSDAELRGLVLHENYHKLYRHLSTWKWLWDIDAQCANMSCDYVINIKIADDNKDGFAKLPECGLLDEKFRGWDSAKVFREIHDPKSGGPSEQYQPGDGGDGEMDVHDWEGAEDLSEADKHALEREIDEAIRQGALAAGATGHGGDNRDLEELLKPEIRWNDVLREFFLAMTSGKDYSTWSRPNRKYSAHGVWLPSYVSERAGGCVLAIDTSGSISQSDLTKMLSEVQGIVDMAHPEYVKVMYWDTEVYPPEHYDANNLDTLVASTKPEGGGGTDVTCVPNYMRDNRIRPEFAVVFTDGHVWGDWGKWDCPVLWCVIDNPRCNPPGRTVHINTARL